MTNTKPSQKFYFIAIFILLMADRFAFYGLFTDLPSILPASHNLDIDHLVIGPVSLFNALLYIAMGLGGYIADRISPIKNNIILGLLCVLFGLILLVIYPNSIYWGLGLTAFGNVLFMPALPRLLAHSINNKATKIDALYTYYYMAINIGSFSAITITDRISIEHSLYLYIAILTMSCAYLLITSKRLFAFDMERQPTFLIKNKLVVNIILLISAAIFIIAYTAESITLILIGIIVVSTIVLLIYEYRKLNKTEKRSLRVALTLTFFAFIFLVPYWQTWNLISYFVLHKISYNVFGFEVGASFYRQFIPLLIVAFCPILATIYNKLSANNNDLSIPYKFALGTLLYGISFLILDVASLLSQHASNSSSTWLVISCALQSLGELLVNALGLAMIFKYVPKRLLCFMSGVWFTAFAMGIFAGSGLTAIIVPRTYSSGLAVIAGYSNLFTILGVTMIIWAFVVYLYARRDAATNTPSNTSYSPTDSIGSKLLKRLSARSLALVVLISIAVFITFNLTSRSIYSRQLSTWIDNSSPILSRALNQHNFKRITEQVNALHSTGLFSYFIVYDQHKHIIDAFPQSSPSVLKHNLSTSLSLARHLTPLQNDMSNLVGYYTYRSNFDDFFLPFLWLGLGCIFLILLAGATEHRAIKSAIQKELGNLNTFLTQLTNLSHEIGSFGPLKNNEAINRNPASKEEKQINEVIEKVTYGINEAYVKIDQMAKTAVKERHNAKLSELARQVTHDLRNYLTGLYETVKSTSEIPTKKREQIIGFLKNINDMSEELLEKYKTEPSEKTKAILFSLSSLIIHPVMIKETHTDSSVTISTHRTPNTYDCFVEIAPRHLRTTMLNLLQNSIEAGAKHITVSLSKQNEGFARITIKDDGCGIPPEILNKLGTEEITHGKEKGNGIGLYYAFSDAKKWGGQLTIDSTVGKGTEIKLTIPLSNPPKTFLPQLELQGIKHIVIIDDDNTMKQKWQDKLKGHSVDISLLNSPEQAAQYFKKPHTNKVLYLVDYQLGLQAEQTGIDLIKQYHLEDKALLVSSAADDPQLIEICEQSNIKLLAKNNISLIPVR